MPFSKCPTCEAMFHLRITEDPKEWYARHAPDKKVGEEVALECFYCWEKSHLNKEKP